MALPAGRRTVASDELRLCEEHYRFYDGWPGPDRDALDAFSAPAPQANFPPVMETIIEEADADFNPHGWAVPEPKLTDQQNQALQLLMQRAARREGK